MLLYRLKSKLDDKYFQTERTFNGQETTSEIWTSKNKLYLFFINLTVSKVQFLNILYTIERENTRTEKLKEYEIVKFFKFF